MRVAYADPPYVGMSKKHYGDHPDYAGEVDHNELITRLECEYDGWILHCHVPSLKLLLNLAPHDVRVCAWVKTFATFKKNVPVAYAWEPVLVKACRKPVVSDRITPLRDWLAEPVALTPGFAGAKPENVCRWLFEVVGLERDDELVDMFPGTGAVSRAWEAWRSQLSLLGGAA